MTSPVRPSDQKPRQFGTPRVQQLRNESQTKKGSSSPMNYSHEDAKENMDPNSEGGQIPKTPVRANRPVPQSNFVIRAKL